MAVLYDDAKMYKRDDVPDRKSNKLEMKLPDYILICT